MSVRYLVPEGQHLPVSKEDGKPDHHLMGAAWAALHGGYRGNKYEGPDKSSALSKLVALYKSEGMETPTATKVAADDDVRELFAPICKVYDGPDGFFVEGVLVAEEPDRVGEIWDYHTSKSAIVEWSEDAKRRTAGKSVGNLRSMHGNVAVGRFTAVDCDDIQKMVHVKAEVVDEGDKEKARKGVYSGFSIKAPYAHRWPDSKNPRNTRWTSGPIIEGSLVDLPCIRSAVFAYKMVTSDHMRELDEIRRFANYEDYPVDGSLSDSNLDALATRVAAKLERGQSKEEEMKGKLKEIAEKHGLAPEAFEKALEDANAAAKASKCMKALGECMDGDCADHKGMSGHGATKAGGPGGDDAHGKVKDGAGSQPSGDGIKMADGRTMVLVGKTSDNVEVYRLAEKGMVQIKTTSDVESVIAEKTAPIYKAIEDLTRVIEKIATTPLPSAVSLREGTDMVDRTADGKTEAEKAAAMNSAGVGPEVAAKAAKEGRPADGIRAIHGAPPALVQTNRGLQRPS